MHRTYIVVEGPHDVAFVARLLHPQGLRHVRKLDELDPAWVPLIPTRFPHRGDLLARVPVPTFIQNATHSVALHSAEGITKIVKLFEESWALLHGQDVRVDGFGIVLDADEGESPITRHAELRRQLEALRLGSLKWPSPPGEVTVGPPRCGAFILPNNADTGTLEDLLLESSATTYPGLHTSATALISRVASDPAALGLVSKDLKEFHKPSGSRKATVAAVASVLRPGKSIAVALQDCRWLDDTAIQHTPRLTAVQAFLHRLLQLAPARDDLAGD